MTTRDAEMDATKEKSGEVESKGPLSSLVELQFRTMECGCQAILYMTGAKTNKIMRLSKLEATCGLSPGCKPPSQSSDDPPQTRSTWSSRSPIPQGSAVESWSRGDNALSVVIRSLVGGRRIGISEERKAMKDAERMTRGPVAHNSDCSAVISITCAMELTVVRARRRQISQCGGSRRQSVARCVASAIPLCLSCG